MGDALAAADLVVSRAGAGAIAELRAAAKPMILVPMGLDASRGDQISNALAEEKAGRALVADYANVVEKIADLLNNKTLRRSLSDACRLSGKTDGARAVAEQIVRVAGNGFQRC